MLGAPHVIVDIVLDVAGVGVGAARLLVLHVLTPSLELLMVRLEIGLPCLEVLYLLLEIGGSAGRGLAPAT